MIRSPYSSLAESARGKLTILALLAINVIIRSIVAARPIEYLDGLTIPDDAYLSLTIARNIAKGLGPLYGFEHTNGFQPLYVFLMVPAFLIFPLDPFPPMRIALFLLIAFDTVTLYLLYRYVSSFTKSFSTPILIAAAWICNPYFIGTSLNGLETSISAFFIVATFYYVRTKFSAPPQRASTQHFFFLGLILGCSILARIDNGLLALAVMAVVFWQEKFRPVTQHLRLFCFTCVGIGLLVMPWLLYSNHYTGDFYPISGKAVRFLSQVSAEDLTIRGLYAPMVVSAAKALLKRNWVQLLLITATGLALFSPRPTSRISIRDSLQPLILPFVYSALLVVAYVFYIFGPWYFERYFYPAGIGLLLVLAVCVEASLARYSRDLGVFTLFAVFLLLILTLNIQQEYFRNLFFSRDKTSMGYMNIGLWAKKEFRDGTIIGGAQTGGLGYFADNLHVVNLDGVVNKSCYESLVQGDYLNYIKSVHIQYIIGWDADTHSIFKHTKTYNPRDLTYIGKIEGFQSWLHEWHIIRVNY
jgi:hypothetical protein